MKATIFLLTMLGLSAFTQAAFHFTGNAAADFASADITSRQLAAYFKNDITQSLECSPWMAEHVPPRYSGLDIQAVHVIYDDLADVLHIGIECNGICGDSDGDGNPSAIDPATPSNVDTGVDTPRMCTVETMNIMTWAGVPETYTINPSKPNFFFPNIISGVNYADCTVLENGTNNWFNWEFQRSASCPYDPAWVGMSSANFRKTCGYNQTLAVDQPAKLGYSGKRLDLNGQAKPDALPIFNNPSASAPSIEWSLKDFSHFPGNNFQAGGVYQPGHKFRVAMAAQSGSSADSCGEDTVNPKLFQIEWDCSGYPNGAKVFDVCGICDGNGQSCLDCAGTVNGTKSYDPCGNCAEKADWIYHDICGICGGTGTSCLDCSGTPNGTKSYDPCGNCAEFEDWIYHDICGICDGDGKSCLDCSLTPNGTKVVDACNHCVEPEHQQSPDICGNCDMDELNCLDCAGTPNGTKSYDPCGNCAEFEDWIYYDVCGICGGEGKSCLDCSGNPNGTKSYDPCGNCAELVDWIYYDVCGICGGEGKSCLDCSGTPNGTKIIDACNQCNEPADYTRPDACGNCGEAELTCLDCFGVVNGTAQYDSYGICNGMDYHDCFNNPYGNATYDNCGVCGGDNSACTCYKYLGYEEPELCFALLRWSVAAARVKISDTLDVLYAIKHELPFYDYKSEKLNLVNYIDSVHTFCEECLDNFDYAQVWFADRLAGNCVGANCQELAVDKMTWEL